MLSNTSLDYISDIGVKNMALLEVSYFTRNIYETKTVTSGYVISKLNLSSNKYSLKFSGCSINR